MKVKNLISQLQKLDPEQAILFQYLTAEHSKLDEAEFAKIVDWLGNFDDFADDLSESFAGWITFAQELTEEQE